MRTITLTTIALAAIAVLATSGCNTIDLERDRGTLDRGSLKADGSNSCKDHCGGMAPAGCWCDAACLGHGDCCADKGAQCDSQPGSCQGHCGKQSPGGCWCDEQCATFGDCCGDVADKCSTGCPPVTCTLYCEHGFKKGADGCETCACADPPPPACTDDSDCPEAACPLGGMLHATCTGGKCVMPPITSCPNVECGQDSDCAGGKPCKQYKCVSGTDCSAMDAAGDGACLAVLGYLWNGTACLAVSGCSCSGADCGKLLTTLTACEAAYAGCTSCAGAWIDTATGNCLGPADGALPDGCCDTERKAKCEQANQTYKQALTAARSCAPMVTAPQCTEYVDEDLICPICGTFVNSTTGLAPYKAAWSTLRCAQTGNTKGWWGCPPVVCDPPLSGLCDLTTSSCIDQFTP